MRSLPRHFLWARPVLGDPAAHRLPRALPGETPLPAGYSGSETKPREEITGLWNTCSTLRSVSPGRRLSGVAPPRRRGPSQHLMPREARAAGGVGTPAEQNGGGSREGSLLSTGSAGSDTHLLGNTKRPWKALSISSSGKWGPMSLAAGRRGLANWAQSGHSLVFPLRTASVPGLRGPQPRAATTAGSRGVTGDKTHHWVGTGDAAGT